MRKLTTEDKTAILIGLFVAAIIAANLLGNKITTLWGISFSVAIFAFPITFLITDIIEEVHGKRKAQSLIYVGVISIIFVLLLTALSIWLPASDRFELNTEYQQIFGVSIRIMIASLIAFTISQTHDVWAFNFWKQKTKGKHLWLRNNVSTIVSQFFDTTIFMFIAFYAITPKFTAPFIFSLIIPYWLLKIVMAIIDTPFAYLGVKWLRNSS